ncbi:MAG: Xaa-Pro dipeptidase [Solirubrobacteraceae bacterium]
MTCIGDSATRLRISRERLGYTEVNYLGGHALPEWLTRERTDIVAATDAPAFAPGEFEARCRRVRDALACSGLDAILVFRPSSVEYLCGFHTINPYPQPLLVTQDELRLYVLDIELARALASATNATINFFATTAVGGVAADSLRLIAKDLLASVGRSARIGVDANDPRVPPNMLTLLNEVGIGIEDGRELVERVRLVLSAAEIEKMERAADTSERAVTAALAAAAENSATDSTVAAAIYAALAAHANSAAAMAPVVATGVRASVWHSSWANVPLAKETTLLEFAGTCDRYHAPVMVTVARRPPNELETRLEGHAQTVLTGILEEARPGRIAGDVADAVAARVGVLDPFDVFHWNFGYTTGLAHPPSWVDGADWSIVSANHEKLQAGMVFHVAASFRNVACAAVGLSHTIVLEGDGARVLTGKNPRIVVL